MCGAPRLRDEEALMTRHYRRDELAAYRGGNDAIVDLAEVGAHLEVCAECTERLQDVDRDWRILTDPGLWRPSGTRPEPSEGSAAEFSAMQQQMAEEDEAADRFFDERLRPENAVATWLDRSLASPAGCTAGLVRRLTRAAREEEEREPERALAILQVAEEVLDRVDAAKDVKRELAGTLWKERANTLQMLGAFAEALAAIDRAESFYATDVVATYLLAFTKWARANVLCEMNAYLDAGRFAVEAAASFHEFGDESHELQVQVLIGAISYEQGDVEAALRKCSALLPKFRAAGDELSVARTLANAGCCYLARFEMPAAQQCAEEAGDLFRAHGAETEVLRTQWAFGRAYLRRGDSETGIAWLTGVAADLRSRGVVVSAAEVELDIIAELLARKRFADAAQLARSLVQVFAAAGTRVNAAYAFEYLAEATREMRATPELVKHVRHVLLHPTQPFVPATDA
jgi:tetratricopeptide (TPR) repeat protein